MVGHRTPLSAKSGRVRLCFLSYRHLSRLALPVLDEFADRAEIQVIDATFDSALEIARKLQGDGAIDAFISAGSNAVILRNGLSTPVATVKATGYDILLALMKARQFSDRVGVITYRETIPELDAIRAMLKIDIAQHAYRTPEEARACVASLAGEGYPIVIGSSVVVELAEEQGLRGILGYSISSIRQGVEDAIDLGRIARLEGARYEQLDGVLHSLQDAVLAVDASHSVIAVNPQMEAVLSQAKPKLIGASLDDIDPALSLKSVLRSGQEELGHVVFFARKEWIVNRTPILEAGQTVGAVITMYDANSIRDADINLRSQRRNQQPTARYSFRSLQGSSPEFVRVRDAALRYAKTDLTVLISGESGTGKELCAQAIHNASARSDKPFVAVNCAAFPESLLESELFGHEEGAFTGSRKGGKRGLFEVAHSGTLFLDEIGDMPLSLQTRLLRVLQEREIMRVGGARPIPINLRVLAATHQPLDAMVRGGRFRADLYYRINILQLTMPPLRARKEDIESMALDILDRCLRRLGSELRAEGVLPPLLERVREYGWPGNVRQLENICERMAVFFAQYTSLNSIRYDLLKFDCPELFDIQEIRSPEVSAVGSKSILQVLQECGNNRAEAARRLGISRATLWRRLKDAPTDASMTSAA